MQSSLIEPLSPSLVLLESIFSNGSIFRQRQLLIENINWCASIVSREPSCLRRCIFRSGSDSSCFYKCIFKGCWLYQPSLKIVERRRWSCLWISFVQINATNNYKIQKISYYISNPGRVVQSKSQAPLDHLSVFGTKSVQTSYVDASFYFLNSK